jgi:exopolysaccharide biosynthesis polyprenyl glycosylphosphotransferase
MTAGTAAAVSLSRNDWAQTAELVIAKRRPQRRNVLIVGAGQRGRELAEGIASNPDDPRRVVGFVDDTPSKHHCAHGVRVLGGTDEILAIARRYSVDEIVVAYAPTWQEQLLHALVASGQEPRVRLKVLPTLVDAAAGRLPSETVRDIPLVDLSMRRPGRTSRRAKRLLDLAVATSILLLTAPLLVLAAIAIKLTSRGPVLFSQRRVGHKGREFMIHKLRTMVQDAESRTGPVLATPDDRRITPVGRFLRKTRIDELPQLFNVLKGDMSMVGPRPERPEFVAEYAATINGYRKRLEVRPGLTGLAQVYGGYATNTFDKLKYDWMYVYRCSMLLDLRILWRTIGVVLGGRGC